jgi:phosphate/sulfate permease
MLNRCAFSKSKQNTEMTMNNIPNTIISSMVSSVIGFAIAEIFKALKKKNRANENQINPKTSVTMDVISKIFKYSFILLSGVAVFIAFSLSKWFVVAMCGVFSVLLLSIVYDCITIFLLNTFRQADRKKKDDEINALLFEMMHSDKQRQEKIRARIKELLKP